MEAGKFYLFSSPFFWSFVGRYVKHLNFQEIVIADAMYFTCTGATFDVLCKTGLVDGTSKCHPSRVDLVLSDGTVVPNGNIIPSQGPKWAWGAKTPWVEKRKGAAS